MFDVRLFRRAECITDPEFLRIRDLLKCAAPDRPLLTREALAEVFLCGTELAVAYEVYRGRCEVGGMTTLCPIVRLGLTAVQLEDVVVDPARRRRGCGRAIIMEVLKVARAAKIPQIRCVGAPFDDAAVAFLTRMRFARVATDIFILSVA